MLELPLQFLKLSGNSLVFGGEQFVLILEDLISLVILIAEGSEFNVVHSELLFVLLVAVMVLLSLFL